jgi:hypothetical protein
MPEQSDGHPKNIKKGFFQMPTNKVKSAIPDNSKRILKDADEQSEVDHHGLKYINLFI